VNWEAVWPVLAFFFGALATRWNDVRRESSAAQRAREAQFETLQRETWVALQDALGQFWKASSELARATIENNRLLDRWLEAVAPAPGESPPTDPSFDSAAAAYVLARQRADTLRSRLWDDETRVIVESAIFNISDYQAKSQQTDKPLGIDRWTWANESTTAAIDALGQLIRTRPESPARFQWLKKPRWLRRPTWPKKPWADP